MSASLYLQSEIWHMQNLSVFLNNNNLSKRRRMRKVVRRMLEKVVMKMWLDTKEEEDHGAGL